MDRILTKQEKEKLVLDLLNQGKSTREIAQEAGMSFRDIGAIRDKATKVKEASKEQAEKISVSTQAYKLFSEDKTPLEVAIELKLEADEVNKYHKEYLKLINRDNLCQIYEEIGDDDIEPFVKLYKSAESSNMNPQHVNRLLAIANNDLPSVEHRCRELERKEAFLKAGNQNAARTFQELSDLISTTRDTFQQYESDCKEKKLEITKLQTQKIELERLVEDFQNNNEKYLQMKHTVKREVENAFANRRQLLRFALLSLI